MALVPALERYLAVHRPVLAALRGRWHQPAGTALWLSAHGSPITEMALYDRVRQLTAAAFGRSVNPHLFRDAAATSLAIQDPAQVRIAAQILGHASFATTERHYNLARSLDAGQAWQNRPRPGCAARPLPPARPVRIEGYVERVGPRCETWHCTLPR